MFTHMRKIIRLALIAVILITGSCYHSTEPEAQICEYNGQIYQSGDSFPAGDGCNHCSCNEGRVFCTLMACREVQAYTRDPLAECVRCVDGEPYGTYACCQEDFRETCVGAGHVVRFTDLHPGYPGVLYGCFLTAPDTGSPCNTGAMCLSGVCDLAGAITTERCTLERKEVDPANPQYYEARYRCATYFPGECGAAIEDRKNPGGFAHTFRMEGKVLLESKQSGPIF